jgi:hypothetical protein
MMQVNAKFRNRAACIFVEHPEAILALPRAIGSSHVRSSTREMSGEEADYLQKRAEAEIELAQRAEHARAVQAHYQLASAYLDRIHGDSPVRGPNALNL